MDRSTPETAASKWAMPTFGSKAGEHSIVFWHSALIVIFRSPERTGPDSEIPMPQTVATKPYDWTYPTTYAGSLEDAGSGDAQWLEGEPTNAQHTIPIAELSRPDPILFYAENPPLRR